MANSSGNALFLNSFFSFFELVRVSCRGCEMRSTDTTVRVAASESDQQDQGISEDASMEAAPSS
jgi:hypothetical protein